MERTPVFTVYPPPGDRGDFDVDTNFAREEYAETQLSYRGAIQYANDLMDAIEEAEDVTFDRSVASRDNMYAGHTPRNRFATRGPMWVVQVVRNDDDNGDGRRRRHSARGASRATGRARTRAAVRAARRRSR